VTETLQAASLLDPSVILAANSSCRSEAVSHKSCKTWARQNVTRFSSTSCSDCNYNHHQNINSWHLPWSHWWRWPMRIHWSFGKDIVKTFLTSALLLKSC